MTFEQYEQEVKRHLTQGRFYHSQCVAAEAAAETAMPPPTQESPVDKAAAR